MFYRLVDLSHWNALTSDPATAFAEAYEYGIRFLALKATQGVSFVDPSFAVRRAAAEAVGLNILAYTFLDAATPAKAQADFLLATIAPLPGIELAIDVEANAGAADGSVTIPLAAEVAQRIADKAGFLPFYYGTRFGPDGKGGGLPHELLSQCPLWLAEWGNQPVCPPGWREWRIWQCTNGRIGRDPLPVPGLGACDRSYIAAGSLDEITRWWSRRTL
jgi:lysozyme